MRLIDVSQALHEGMLGYPGDVPFTRSVQRRIADGDPLNLSALQMSAHTGTHIDAPYHFLEEGSPVDRLPLNAFSGAAIVLDCTAFPEAVGPAAFPEGSPQPGEIVLLKTQNSTRRTPAFDEGYVYLEAAAAEVLVARRAKAVGIDALSIEGYRVSAFPTHHVLLSQGVGIIEGLDLSEVAPGRYGLLCLPLRVVGGDGAPARAILVEGGSAMEDLSSAEP